MSLQTNLRVVALLLACAGLALAPAAADAKGKPKKPRKPAATTKFIVETGLVNRIGLPPATQLDAANTAIKAAAAWFTGRDSGCSGVTPMLTSREGRVIGGNFRDGLGGCYVWLNVHQTSWLTGPEICKTTLHEMGHLYGLAHSDDTSDLMYAPFNADPIPEPCAVRSRGV